MNHASMLPLKPTTKVQKTEKLKENIEKACHLLEREAQESARHRRGIKSNESSEFKFKRAVTNFH